MGQRASGSIGHVGEPGTTDRGGEVDAGRNTGGRLAMVGHFRAEAWSLLLDRLMGLLVSVVTVGCGLSCGGTVLLGIILFTSRLVQSFVLVIRLSCRRTPHRTTRRLTITFFRFRLSFDIESGGAGGAGGGGGGGGAGEFMQPWLVAGAGCFSTARFGTLSRAGDGITGEGRPRVDGLPRLTGGVPKSSMRMCDRLWLDVERELTVPGKIGLSSGVAFDRVAPIATVTAAVLAAAGDGNLCVVSFGTAVVISFTFTFAGLSEVAVTGPVIHTCCSETFCDGLIGSGLL